MKTWIRLGALALAVALAPVAGCGDDDDDGDDDVPTIDGGTADAGADAGGEPATFTAFVIDLVDNQTADDTDAVTIDFALPDPDQDNPDAYAPLFP